MSIERVDTVSSEPFIGSRATNIGFAVLALALIGLAGRLLSYPLNRDENMFVSVASQLGNGDLYRDLGYNHLPNLAYLLGGVFAITGTEYYLLFGRLLVLAAWLAAILALWLIVRRLGLGLHVFFASSALLLGNVLLLGTAGMLVSNNFLPIPLIFFAFYFLLGALDESRGSKAEAFFAGLLVSLTIGMKANFIMLAPTFALVTLLAPSTRHLSDRIKSAFLPLAIGGAIGGLPTLAHLALDPEGFLAHTLRYFTELQPAYWQNVDEPKVVGLAAKILLAEQIWFASATLLAIAAIVGMVFAAITQSGLRSLFDWRVILLTILLGCSVAVAFVPSPSFQQYFVPPIPFLILLFIVLARFVSGEGEGAKILVPVMLAIAVTSLALGASRIAPGLMQFANPGKWESIALKREVAVAGQGAGLQPGARIATLTPLFALEGGYSIYPEFAAGQFVYRVAPYLPDDDSRYYRTTSPSGLEAFFDADPPAGILVNRAEPIEKALAEYAQSRGYIAYENQRVADGFDLYVAPESSRPE